MGYVGLSILPFFRFNHFRLGSGPGVLELGPVFTGLLKMGHYLKDHGDFVTKVISKVAPLIST